jgi:hypothetical protein
MKHEPTIGNGVSPNLDDTAIWSCAFKSQFLISVFEAAAEFRLDVVGAELERVMTSYEDGSF